MAQFIVEAEVNVRAYYSVTIDDAKDQDDADRQARRLIRETFNEYDELIEVAGNWDVSVSQGHPE